MELKNKAILRKSIVNNPSAIGQGPAQAMIENLESLVEIEKLRAQDLVSEASEDME